MNLWRNIVCGSTSLLLVLTWGCDAGERSSAPTTPPAQKVLELARKANFSSSAEPDVPAPPHIRSLNPGFQLTLFRAQTDVPPTPGHGAIISRAVIQGAPAHLDLPNGEYFLWLSGSADSRHAALVSADGETSKTVEVFSRPSGPTLRWEVQSSLPASGEPLAPSCANGTLWLQICLGTGQMNGAGAAQECVRVPAS